MKNIWLLLILFIVGCSNPQKQLKVEVGKLEAELTKGYSKEKADQLNAEYLAYINKYPEDTLSKEFMMRGVETAIVKNDPAEAIQFIDMFLAKYPNDAKAPMMQFKKGVVYELLYQDPVGAIAQYEAVLHKYPGSPVQKEAENAILLLKDPAAFLNDVIKDGQGDSIQAKSK